MEYPNRRSKSWMICPVILIAAALVEIFPLCTGAAPSGMPFILDLLRPDRTADEIHAEIGPPFEVKQAADGTTIESFKVSDRGLAGATVHFGPHGTIRYIGIQLVNDLPVAAAPILFDLSQDKGREPSRTVQNGEVLLGWEESGIFVAASEKVIRKIWVSAPNVSLEKVFYTTAEDYYFGRNGCKQDYRQALKHYLDAAQLGMPAAQYSIGWMYYKGKGVKKDYVTARSWFLKAALQGHVNSQNSLGKLYSQGKGVAQDYQKSIKWYRLAAEQGNSIAQTNLGNKYYNGHGVKQDYGQAIQWYRKAAAQGHARAQTILGYMYDKGEGVPQDHAQAVAWYRKAAEQGFTRAIYILGRKYEKGIGVARDRVEAVRLYQKAAGQGDKKAKKALQRLGKP